MHGTPTRVWLDDRNEIFRRGMASCLLAEGFSVVGESRRLSPAPDVAAVDILVFDLDDACLPRVAQLMRGTGTRAVGIARSVSEQLLFDTVEAGVSGVRSWPDLTPGSLVSALRTVAAGNGSMPPGLLARLLDELARSPGKRGSAARLARREREVLRLLADGANTREIAQALCYSERTVKNVVHDSLLKLNCHTRTQAVALAARQGLI
jgi:DNA-binding NarL/FixJ family response regulator